MSRKKRETKEEPKITWVAALDEAALDAFWREYLRLVVEQAIDRATGSRKGDGARKRY